MSSRVILSVITALLVSTSARATVITYTHEFGGHVELDFPTHGYGGYQYPWTAPVGFITVTEEQNLYGFGVDFKTDASAKTSFAIFEITQLPQGTAGQLLYVSPTAQTFADNTLLDYKYSEEIDFVLHPGTRYGLAAVVDSPATFAAGYVGGTVGGVSTSGNGYVEGPLDNPVYDSNYGGVDIWTALEIGTADAPVAVPEPTSLALLGTGCVAIGLLSRRRRSALVGGADCS